MIRGKKGVSRYDKKLRHGKRFCVSRASLVGWYQLLVIVLYWVNGNVFFHR